MCFFGTERLQDWVEQKFPSTVLERGWSSSGALIWVQVMEVILVYDLTFCSPWEYQLLLRLQTIVPLFAAAEKIQSITWMYSRDYI